MEKEMDINMSNGECDYMNIPGEQFMDYYYCQIPENNLISKFTLLNNIYFENYLKFQENKKRQNNKNNDNQNNKEVEVIYKGNQIITKTPLKTWVPKNYIIAVVPNY